MLLRFVVSNHRSIMEPVELSMIAVDQDRPAARGFDALTERVLTVAGIYGPNASGKSNVLEALAWLSQAVRLSLVAWDEGVPREPFKFGHGPTTPSAYEIDLIIRGVRYTYMLEVDDRQVLFEGLYSYPERRRRTLFEREGMELHLRRGLGALSGTRELLTPPTLALSAATRFEDVDVTSVGRFLRSVGVLGSGRLARAALASTVRLFDPGVAADPGYSTEDRISALALLRLADPAVEDVAIERDTLEEPSAVRLRLLHRGREQHLPFDFDDESEGTRTWFSIIGTALESLRTGQPLLFDEVDRSLHPHLSAKLLGLFQDPETNPRGAQLVFTSHDTSLLNHLNRDEVWLTEKGIDGTTSLTALAEYGGDRVRRSLNIERAYLQGRFGAVPDVDQAFVRQAIGLSVGDA